MGKIAIAKDVLTGGLTRLAEMLRGAPRDKVGGIKVLGSGSDPTVDRLLAHGHAPMGDNLFFGGPRNVDPTMGRQAFLATKPSHSMYYASLQPKGAMSVFRGDLSSLPVIDNDTPGMDPLIEMLLGYTTESLHNQKTWSRLPMEHRKLLEQIQDTGGAKLLNVGDLALTAPRRMYPDVEHVAPQYLALPKALKTLEKRKRGGLISMRGEK